MAAQYPGGVSRREAEVLAALAGRLTNIEIADSLHISVRTVESHVSSLLRKLGAADRRALAAIGQQAGRDALPVRLSGLPAARTSFVGRVREGEALHGALREARLVTLVGPGGVGKTRLAAVVAERAAPSFPSGGWFVDLVPVRSGFIEQAVAAALGVAEGPQQSLQEAIAERLRDGRALLVLDNCEHVIGAVAAFVDWALTTCPDLTVLATSRERLGLPGERMVPTAPLPVASDATVLFRDRAVAADPEFTAEPAVVAGICAKLDGVPLAIELAAARSASLGADGLRAALEDSLRLLSGGRGAVERHRSLRAVIGWSHDLLDEEERSLFERVAVFAGGFDLNAAVFVARDGDRAVVADVLGRLVDKSLVVHERAAARWRLLETVRAFAGDRLAAGEEHADVQERYLRWAQVTAAELEGAVAGRWRAEFDAVVDDLRAALANAAPGRSAVSHRLARSLGHLTYARRFLNEALEHYREAARRAPTPGEAAADLRSAADCAHVVDCSDRVVSGLLLDSAEQARAAGDGNARAIALARAVETTARFPPGLTMDHDPGQIRGLLDDAVAAGDPDDPVVAAGLAVAGVWHARIRNEPLDAVAAEHAVAAARAAGDPALLSTGLDALAFVAADAGRLREAHRISQERVELLAALDRDDPRTAVELDDILHTASVAAVAAGDLPAALSVARRALADDLIGDHPRLSTSKVIPALVLTGDFGAALRYAERLWDGRRAAGGSSAHWLAPAVCAAALACGLRGDAEAFALWRARTFQIAGDLQPDAPGALASFLAFVDARVAVRTGRTSGVTALTERAFGARGRYQTYAAAAGAELAVVAGLPDAAERLAAATPAAAENDWAAACLSRATGRLHHDAKALEASAVAWERIGARFERAVTLLLLPDRAAEGRAELAVPSIGAPVPDPAPEPCHGSR
ncbi:ATP-binding protein [Actinomadura scrupuli]|uniref:ATP-binding protein n=1 Tax=Actinomadura scrupuli TaxID=559629 RepID=UPI003D954958